MSDWPLGAAFLLVKYQPDWWFQTEGVLDETQAFERRGRRLAGPGEGALRSFGGSVP
jgi:hypothetical protein